LLVHVFQNYKKQNEQLTLTKNDFQKVWIYLSVGFVKQVICEFSLQITYMITFLRAQATLIIPFINQGQGLSP